MKTRSIHSSFGLAFAIVALVSIKAFALGEAFVGTYRSSGSGRCLLTDSHAKGAHSLKIVRSTKAVQLRFDYADGKSPDIMTFVYGRSRTGQGGGQVQNFITSPDANTLRLVRNETDFRNHAVSLYSITLTKTPNGLKFQSRAHQSLENAMNCSYSSDL